jgi:hypothetical protein
MAEIPVLKIGKWSLGYSQNLRGCVLALEFADHEPLNLAIPFDDAVQMAKAILDQQKNPPPRSDRMN